MGDDIEALISGYLDDELVADEQLRLSVWINADPDHADEFAKRVMLHNRLFDLSRVGTDIFQYSEPTLCCGRGSGTEKPDSGSGLGTGACSGRVGCRRDNW